MNDEACKCYRCNVEIPANMGFVVSRKSDYRNKEIIIDLCDECWYFEGKEWNKVEIEGLDVNTLMW